MTFASRCLRRFELALWYVGVALLGVALGATFDRWHYQAQQERAFFESAAMASPAVERRDAWRAPLQRELVGPVAPAGPPLPPLVAGAAQEKKPVPAAAPRKTRPAADPSVYGRIEIPRLGLEAFVREGADEKTLARAVGLVPEGARPGQLGNVVMAAHRDTFFRPLRNIRINDRIRVVVPPHEYEYRVDSYRVVSPEETSVLQSKGVEELTLVTCYPFRFVGPAPDRFIVSATRVN